VSSIAIYDHNYEEISEDMFSNSIRIFEGLEYFKPVQKHIKAVGDFDPDQFVVLVYENKDDRLIDQICTDYQMVYYFEVDVSLLETLIEAGFYNQYWSDMRLLKITLDDVNKKRKILNSKYYHESPYDKYREELFDVICEVKTRRSYSELKHEWEAHLRKRLKSAQKLKPMMEASFLI